MELDLPVAATITQYWSGGQPMAMFYSGCTDMKARSIRLSGVQAGLHRPPDAAPGSPVAGAVSERENYLCGIHTSGRVFGG